MYDKATIVLGCGIDAVGTLNDDAKNSVRLGIDAVNTDNKSCLIMTGNVSYKATFKPSISEAQAMKDYAISLGVPTGSIFVETESKDSIGNLCFTKENLLLPLGITDVNVVRGPNQSTERIGYLINKVFGKDISWRIIEPEIERPQEQKREAKSLSMAKKWLDSIIDGDAKAIYSLLREKHPGYNSALNLDGLEELL